jgi:hypothetical protein
MQGSPMITGNTIEESATGLVIEAKVDATITGNTFCGNMVDFRTAGGAAPLPPGNTVCLAGGSPSAAP